MKPFATTQAGSSDLSSCAVPVERKVGDPAFENIGCANTEEFHNALNVWFPKSVAEVIYNEVYSDFRRFKQLMPNGFVDEFVVQFGTTAQDFDGCSESTLFSFVLFTMMKWPDGGSQQNCYMRIFERRTNPNGDYDWYLYNRNREVAQVGDSKPFLEPEEASFRYEQPGQNLALTDLVLLQRVGKEPTYVPLSDGAAAFSILFPREALDPIFGLIHYAKSSVYSITRELDMRHVYLSIDNVDAVDQSRFDLTINIRKEQFSQEKAIIIQMEFQLRHDRDGKYFVYVWVKNIFLVDRQAPVGAVVSYPAKRVKIINRFSHPRLGLQETEESFEHRTKGNDHAQEIRSNSFPLEAVFCIFASGRDDFNAQLVSALSSYGKVHQVPDAIAIPHDGLHVARAMISQYQSHPGMYFTFTLYRPTMTGLAQMHESKTGEARLEIWRKEGHLLIGAYDIKNVRIV